MAADPLAVSEPHLMPQPLASSQTQPVRIRFPDRFLTTRTHGDSSRSSSLSFATPGQPMLQSRSHNGAAIDPAEGGRRVHSLGPDSMVSGSNLSKNAAPRHYASRRKNNPSQTQSTALSPLKVDPFLSDFEPSAFSDEYDLCEFSITFSLQLLNLWTVLLQLVRASKYNLVQTFPERLSPIQIQRYCRTSSVPYTFNHGDANACPNSCILRLTRCHPQPTYPRI